MEPKKMRCHISIIIENAGSLIGALVAFAISQVDDIVRNLSKLNHIEGKSYFIGMGIFILVVTLVLLWNLNRWYKTTIWLDNGMLIVEQNTLNKRKNTYTLQNISNIDMEQNLFERIIGTYKIKIDTNSAALAKKTDIKIVFSRQVALDFKKEIMSSMDKTETEVPIDENGEYDVVYSVRDILLNCFYTANIFSILFLVAGVVIFFVVMQTGESHYTISDFMRDAIGSFAAIVIAFISAAYSLVKGFFRYYDFKARRCGNKIQLTYGLLRKSMYTIPVEKVNGIKLVQPFFSRIFGRYQVEVINVGTGDEKNESSNILLSCTKEEVKQYMEILLPEYQEFIEQNITRQSPKYFLHKFEGLVYIIVFLAVGLSVFHYFVDTVPVWTELGAALGLVLVYGIGCVVSYFAGGYFIGENYLIISTGIFTKTCTMVRYEKIQHMDIKASIMTGYTKLKDTSIHILAALTSSTMSLPLLEDNIIEEIAGKMIETA
jgi:uncharacterized membrane protein YdbT with pleckstrin-like domain